MPAHRFLSSILVAFLLVGLTCTGCSERPRKVEENQAAHRLRKIAHAYDIGLLSGRMPRSAEDLKPLLKQASPTEDPEDMLRSPNDGESFEIMWGVNLDRQTELDLILAHEKKGKDGKRYVLTVARLVSQMGDADFENARFAKGKR